MFIKIKKLINKNSQILNFNEFEAIYFSYKKSFLIDIKILLFILLRYNILK